MGKLFWVALVIPLALLLGCSTDHPRPLSAEQFYSSQQGIGSSSPLSSLDQPGQIPSRDLEARPSLPPLSPGGVNIGVAPPIPTTQGTLASFHGAGKPSTRPSASEPAFPTEQYLTLGTVVAVVGDSPIYANDVIRRDSAILHELAKEYDATRFEIAARERIDETTRELEIDELEYEAALKSLDSNDRETADRLTDLWRQRMITEAGGSLEVARRRAEAEGKDFQQMVTDQHRAFLIQIYQARTIYPQVEVTATDKRRYYQTHFDTDFSKPDKAMVWIIHTDPSDIGQDLALSKIKDFRKRALAGEDFGTMAKSQDSSIFTEPREIEQHSLALLNVDKAIWKLLPGQVSDVVQDTGGYYLIKMISLDKGGTRPFEDEAVQDEITSILRSQQLQKLNQERLNQLFENAVVRSDPAMVDAAVDMVMQNYTKWSQKSPQLFPPQAAPPGN
jgi:parvulin-like peptidyl-prolyl isomerase